MQLLSYLFTGLRETFPCRRRRIQMYNTSPSEAFCFRHLFKVCFFLKAHLETWYDLLCLPATSKELIRVAFFFLTCAFAQRKKKKGNQNPETSKAAPKIDPERKKKQSIRCSTPQGNNYNLEKKTGHTVSSRQPQMHVRAQTLLPEKYPSQDPVEGVLDS